MLYEVITIVRGTVSGMWAVPFFNLKSMEKQENIKKLQVVKFEVKKGQTFEFNGNTKTEHDRIKGIFLRLSNPQALPGATLRVWIDDTEIIPDDTEVALLHHNNETSIKDVAFPMDEKAKNSPVRIIYRNNFV